MISLHSYESQDWSGNGECGLYPDVCDIKKVAAGLYELELEHQITDDGRALAIQRGMLIKAPVPARETPLISISAQGHAGQAQHDIWAVHITASYARLYNKASTGGKVLERLKNGVVLVYLSKYNDNWHKVTAPSGKTGYMRNADIQYLRTEPYIPALPSYQTAVLPRQVREQLFRVYDVNTDDETHKVKALARHISYGQLRNFVKTFSPKDMELQTALDAMSADLINEHDYHYYTNISGTITADWALKNGVQAILDPDEGAAVKMNAQVVRDNFDIFLLQNTETDRDVVIESGKNLLGLTCHVNDDNVVTRIMPYGTDAAGKILLLPEIYIDSQYFGNYPEPRAIPLQVSEAVERAASGNDPGMTKDQAYAKLRAAVQAKYDAGIDLPDFDIQVKFLQLGDTEEYKALKELEKVYLYDTVTVKHGQLGMLYKVQMIGYTFNGVLERYTDVTFGNIKNGAELGSIAGFQLPNGGVSGQKLVPGSVGSQQLRELSVLAAHIGLAQIVNAHIQDATIDRAKIKDFVAEVAAIAVAKIGDAWIDTAWIDKLTAEVVDIVTANIGTLIADSATIQWAQIANLTAAVTDIVLAKIQTANIGWAQITGLVADTALFTQGVSGKLYCADFMATDANIESLSANKIAGGMATFGKLMLMGQDNKLYEINVGSLGEVTATEKKMGGDNVGDYVLTDRNMANGTLTARTLNVQQIFGDNALVRQLIAQCIDTDTLFANLGYINALRTYLIQSDVGQYLNLQSNTGIQMMVSDAVGNVKPSDTNLLPDSRISMSTDFGQQYLYSRDISSFITANTQYTLGVRGWRVTSPARLMVYVFKNDWSWFTSFEITSWTPDVQSVTFTTPSDISNIYITIENPGENGSFGRIYADWLKLVLGNRKPLAWSPTPGEVQISLDRKYDKVTGITIQDGLVEIVGHLVRMITEQYYVSDNADVGAAAFVVDAINKLVKAQNISVQTLLLNGQLQGNGHNVLTKSSDTVVDIPAGPAAQSVINAIPKYRLTDVTFNFSGSYQGIVITGFYGPGVITLSFAAGTSIDQFSIKNNGCTIVAAGNSSQPVVIMTPTQYYSMTLENGRIIVTNFRVTGPERTSATAGTGVGILIKGANVDIRDSIVERSRDVAIYVIKQSTVYASNLRGGQTGGNYSTPANLGGGIDAEEGSVVTVSGTGIIGNAYNLSNYNSPPIQGTITPTASPGAYTPPTQYTVKYVYEDSRYASFPESAGMGTGASNWNDSSVRGGRYSVPDPDVRYAGAWRMRLNGGAVQSCLTGLAGKTIKSATLTVHCETCPVGTTTHDLYYLHSSDLPYGQGSPLAFLTDTGLDITITQGQDTVLNITAWLQAKVNAGTPFYGFGLPTTGLYVRMADVCMLDIVYE